MKDIKLFCELQIFAVIIGLAIPSSSHAASTQEQIMSIEGEDSLLENADSVIDFEQPIVETGKTCGCSGKEYDCSPEIFICGSTTNTPSFKTYSVNCLYNAAEKKCYLEKQSFSEGHLGKLCDQRTPSHIASSCEKITASFYEGRFDDKNLFDQLDDSACVLGENYNKEPACNLSKEIQQKIPRKELVLNCGKTEVKYPAENGLRINPNDTCLVNAFTNKCTGRCRFIATKPVIDEAAFSKFRCVNDSSLSTTQIKEDIKKSLNLKVLEDPTCEEKAKQIQ